MLTYITRRLIAGVVVLLATLTLIWIFLELIPGDITDVFEQSRPLDETTRRNLRAFYGVDRPWWERYGSAMWRTITFDFGRSLENRKVIEILGETLPTSARIAFWALITYPIASTMVGAMAAVKRYSFFDSVTAVVSVVLAGIPAFVMGITLQWLTGVKPYQWGWPSWAQLPIIWEPSKIDFIPYTPIPTTGWKQLILPVITLSCVNFASNTRGARTAMLEVLRADYMRTARAKGLSPRRVLFKHGLRNGSIPIVTGFGADVISVFGVAVLTETVFNIPGIGSRVAQAVGVQDQPTVLALCAVIVIATVLVNLLIDVSYGWLDPRVRIENSAGGQ